MNSFLYFKLDNHPAKPAPEVSVKTEAILWRPGIARVFPPGAPRASAFCYWAFHHLRLFRNRDCVYLLLRIGGKTVHYSTAYPGYSRFPFMAPADLQIGNIWTDPRLRGSGLATHGVATLAAAVAAPSRNVWYVVDTHNLASIRVAEKTGFRYHAAGKKRKDMLCGLASRYVIDGSTASASLRAAA